MYCHKSKPHMTLPYNGMVNVNNDRMKSGSALCFWGNFSRTNLNDSLSSLRGWKKIYCQGWLLTGYIWIRILTFRRKKSIVFPIKNEFTPRVTLFTSNSMTLIDQKSIWPLCWALAYMLAAWDILHLQFTIPIFLIWHSST